MDDVSTQALRTVVCTEASLVWTLKLVELHLEVGKGIYYGNELPASSAYLRVNSTSVSIQIFSCFEKIIAGITTKFMLCIC